MTKRKERRKNDPLRAYILRKQIFALLFLAGVFGYAGLNVWYGGDIWMETVEESLAGGISPETAPDTIAKTVSALDESIIGSMYGRMEFIETYSYIQALLDKREFNNFSYIKDEDGYLHYASFFREDTNDIEEYARRLRRLQDCVEPKGTKVLFFVTPGKYVRGETDFRTGMPVNDPDTIVDEMLFYLNRYGVETVDCRKYIPNETLSIQEAFFKTDHHWTIPAAFAATQVLVEQMNEKFGAGLDPDGFYMDPANYESVTYHQGMLGSMGRKTGANFSGLEDFEALWPTFENKYDRHCMGVTDVTQHFRGDTTESLMDVDVLLENGDIYSDSQYSLYLNGLRPYEHIVNEDNPDGVKIFAIRDSYFSPMMVFLAPMCSELDAIWSLEESHVLDIESYVRENEFDYIIMEIYPYNINGDAFNFFKGE
ncbi:MAG: hypothetical protein K2H37_09415 [Lachnospiraceae bacterium]|nr:hypothetical protein [Lachnospiraceae bacterium]